MQTTAATLPTPAVPSPLAATAGAATDTATDTGGNGDFAALLLGQLVGEIAESAVSQDIPATETAPTESTLQDPAQLLAALGLPFAPAASQTTAAEAPTDGERILTVADSLAGDRRLASLTARETAASDAGMRSPLTAMPPGARTDLALQAQPANFAALEAGFAENPEGNTTPAPQAISVAAPPSLPARPVGEHLQMATPLREPAWQAEFGQKIVWMATNERQNAQLTLNPPQMGPIEISLSVKNEQATAIFVSANPEVREAIESSLPRLREMLAGVGVELGQTNVSAESFRQAQDQRQGGRAQGGGEGGNGRGEDPSVALAGGSGDVRHRGNGLVDTFA